MTGRQIKTPTIWNTGITEKAPRDVTPIKMMESTLLFLKFIFKLQIVESNLRGAQF